MFEKFELLGSQKNGDVLGVMPSAGQLVIFMLLLRAVLVML